MHQQSDSKCPPLLSGHPHGEMQIVYLVASPYSDRYHHRYMRSAQAWERSGACLRAASALLHYVPFSPARFNACILVAAAVQCLALAYGALCSTGGKERKGKKNHLHGKAHGIDLPVLRRYVCTYALQGIEQKLRFAPGFFSFLFSPSLMIGGAIGEHSLR